MAIRKPIAALAKAKAALIQAGMSPTMARNVAKLLDLDSPLKAQIVQLAEDDPELFEPEDDEAAQEAKRPMTTREAQLSRLQAGRRHRPMPLRTDSASAKRAAEVLTRGVGRSADR